MSLYLFLYIIISIFLIFVWNLFYKKYNNIWWIGFLLFTIFISLWFISFLLTYYWTTNIDLLLQISKFTYWFSLLAIYSFLIFVIYFNKNWNNIKMHFFVKIIMLLIVLFSLLTFFSPFIIEWMYFNDAKLDYYEKTWILFNIYIFLELLFFPLFLYFIFNKYKTLYSIDKIRFKYIFIWIFLFAFLALLFQLVLPSFWIYLLEKEVILFIVPFLIISWYSIWRYHFALLSLKYRTILIIILSIFTTICIFYVSRIIYLLLWDGFIWFWGLSYNFSYIDLITGILLYSILYKIFDNLFSWNSNYNNLISRVSKLKSQIPFITDLNTLNLFLSKNLNPKFNINYAYINLFVSWNKEKNELKKYFTKDNSRDLFINDIVFIEENKHKFDYKKISKEINKKTYLVFPMFNNLNELIWFFELWSKTFKEHYSTEEIDVWKNFVSFLVWHLKYIEMYSDINYLNLNLDKKVDEKTIEYNNLISKQREFISMSSHEIKTPVMATWLQIESIIDDVKSWDYNEKYLKEELNILKIQIFKVTELVKTIFTAQKIEWNKEELYIEKVKVNDLIIFEIETLHKSNKNVKFIFEKNDKLWFINLDKVQFTQVISNLLHNALKFADKIKPIIKIKLINNWKNIEIEIEDNWKWFDFWQEKLVFEKYATWKGLSKWLWLWLYLCKKIVELHKWKINAYNSKTLKWARIKIVIPKELKMERLK